jgi:phage terminase large subunit
MATATINLLPKQTEAWDIWESPDITELGYGGAAGGGKTRLGWYLVITTAEMYPQSRVAVGRKELKNFKATTLLELWEIFKEMGYQEGRDYHYSDQKSVLTFANGSEVVLKDTAYSPQDPEYTSLGGLPLTWAWLDESNETPEKAKSILKTRVGRMNYFKDGKCVSNVLETDEEGEDYTIIKPFWFETFNPNKGHVHRDYYKPWKEGTMPPYRMFVRALPGDNPHLSQAYLDQLKRSDKVTRERLLLGNFDFDDDPQKVMNYEAVTDLPTNTLVGNENVKMLIADVARFGGDKIVLGTYNGLELYGLYVYTYQGIDETIKRMKEVAIMEGIGYQNILADEDGVGGGVVDGLRGIKGFGGGRSPLPIWDFVQNRLVPANYKNLRSQCYFKLGEMVNNRETSIKITKFDTNIEGYTIEKALSDITEELDAIKQTDNSMDGKLAIIPKSDIKEMLGRSPDFADVLMMRMLFQFREMPITYKSRLRDDEEEKEVNPAI